MEPTAGRVRVCVGPPSTGNQCRPASPISVRPCRIARTPSTRQSRRFHFFTARQALVRTWQKVPRQRQPTFTLISPQPRLRLLRHRRWFRQYTDGDVLLHQEARGRTGCCLTLTHPPMALCSRRSWCGRSPNHTGQSTRRPPRPAQWLPTAAIEPDEGPDSIGSLTSSYRKEAGTDPSLRCGTGFCGRRSLRTMSARRAKQPIQRSKRWLKRLNAQHFTAISARPFQRLTVGASGCLIICSGNRGDAVPCGRQSRQMPRCFPLPSQHRPAGR